MLRIKVCTILDLFTYYPCKRFYVLCEGAILNEPQSLLALRLQGLE